MFWASSRSDETRQNQQQFTMVQLPVDGSRQGDGIEPSAVVQWKEDAFSFNTVPHSMAGFIFWRNAMARWNP